VSRAPDDHTPSGPPDFGPGPSRSAFLVAYVGVIVAGLLGGLIGYGLVDVSTHGSDKTLPLLLGALIGAALAAVGTGVVAVLALRAMAEWRRPDREQRGG
jgi:hypothetical protein